jgi:hypothetical protein
MAETLPPLTIQGLEEALANPNFKAYVYIGNAQDTGWALAISAQRMLAAVRVYLVTTKALADTVRQHFEVAPDSVGIVFGWELDVRHQLSKAEAEDFLTVAKAIADA